MDASKELPVGAATFSAPTRQNTRWQLGGAVPSKVCAALDSRSHVVKQPDTLRRLLPRHRSAVVEQRNVPQAWNLLLPVVDWCALVDHLRASNPARPDCSWMQR